MFSRPKILFLVSLLFVALLNPKFNPYLLFKFLIFYHSSRVRFGQINHNSGAAIEVISGLDVSLLHGCCWIKVQQGYDLYPHGIYRGYSTICKTVHIKTIL